LHRLYKKYLPTQTPRTRHGVDGHRNKADSLSTPVHKRHRRPLVHRLNSNNVFIKMNITTIGDALNRWGKPGTDKPSAPKKKAPNSERAEQVEKLLYFMGDAATTEEERTLERNNPGKGKEAKRKRVQKRIRYWFGRTRKLQPGDIYRLMEQAKTGKNSPALFNHLLKIHGKSNT